MLQCWNQNALKRPSFKETTVFLNSQLQKLSKTMSSISSFSSISSNNELKKFNTDSPDFKIDSKESYEVNNEADDEQTSDVFYDENRKERTENLNETNINLVGPTKSLNDVPLREKQHHQVILPAKPEMVLNKLKNIEQKNFLEMITRLNLNTNHSTSNQSTNHKINSISDNDNFTDSNYESASSYYSSTSPNHQNSNINEKNNIYEKAILSPSPPPLVLSATNPQVTSLAHITSVEANDSATDCDSPLISAKNLLVRMSYDKPFYMNNNNSNNNNIYKIKYDNEIIDVSNGSSYQKSSAPKKSSDSSSSTTSSSRTISAPKILISPSIEDFKDCKLN